ncbi:XRE family transcriptional regulator [Streptomyces sp. NPDC016845]|uniref:XRE family transcriptional regulator n=1 Tax=Streptomyces sp. NPDC016845 TaxID=3364972 RepID=UPI0037B40B10
MLWPQVVKDRIKTGTDLELVHGYPCRSAAPSSLWADLAEGATNEIFLAGYTNYFFWSQVPAFPDLLRRGTEAGCRVRFLIGDPDGEVTRQREVVENTALSVSSAAADAAAHVALSVFRFDDNALVTPHLARMVGHDSPMLHLRRHAEGGMFDRFRDHAEELWGRGVPVTT